jgi:hypothetical protein
MASFAPRIHAQAPPESAQPEAPRSAWAAVRAERDQERLVLSDAWLAYLDTEERDQLRTQRWMGALFFTIATGAWIAFAIDNESRGRDTAATVAFSAGAAASLGLGAATLLTSDLYAARKVGMFGFAAEFAFAAAALGFATHTNSCGFDCPELFGALAASTALNALAIASLELLAPPIFVSQHYARYRSLPDSERAQFGIDLLLAREARARTIRYTMFGTATLGALGYGCAALLADTHDGRLAFAALGAVTLSTAFVNLLISELQSEPSEKLFAGEAPPKPDAF